VLAPLCIYELLIVFVEGVYNFLDKRTIEITNINSRQILTIGDITNPWKGKSLIYKIIYKINVKHTFHICAVVKLQVLSTLFM